jgi:hypothetical protein
MREPVQQHDDRQSDPAAMRHDAGARGRRLLEAAIRRT